MIYDFEDFELDIQRYELRHAGTQCALEPQAFKVLIYLVENRDRVVRKDELLEHLWPGQHVSEGTLSQRLMLVRKVVGDSGRRQRVIKTVHGLGYRFVAEIETRDASSTALPRTCPLCQHSNGRSARFCADCGASLILACLHCGQEVLPAATFCPGCGQRLDPPSDSEPAPLAAPRLESSVDTPVPLDRPEPEGERKLVTVLCGVLASDGVAALDRELDALLPLMQAVHALVRPEVERYEGTLQPMMGTSFLALFGAPVTQEDHARRAVLAALGVQQQLRQDTLSLQWPSGEAVVLRLALHTGTLAFEPLGDDSPYSHAVVGETTTLGMALAQQAIPGTILLSDTTLQLVAQEVNTAAPPQQVSTHAGPMAVTQLIAHLPQKTADSTVAARPRSPFLGRDADLATLHTRLARVVRGQGQIVGIMGAPGMGKSRLLAEFCQSLDGSTVTYLQGYCRSYGRAMPYLPVLDLLRTAWGVTAADAVLANKVRAGLRAVVLDPDTWMPYFLALLGREIESEPDLSPLRPETLREQTFEALHQWHLAHSQHQPLIVVIEDLHWIDPTSEAYLAALAERLVGASILLLVTFRPGYRPPWMDKSYATHISLQPLDLDPSQHLVHAVSRQTQLSAALEQQIIRQAEGNPFFLEELAIAAIEPGGRALTMPDTIQAVLMSRIDRLPPAAKRLLQVAAVCGATVPLALLQAITALPEATFHENLGHLRAVELLYEMHPFREPAYAFQHALTQEVTYQSLLLRTRQQLHQRIAQALVEHCSGTVKACPELLAYHYTHAGCGPQAMPYWLQAAQRAIRRAAHAEAREHLAQGQAVLQTLPASPARTEQELTLQLLLSAAGVRRRRAMTL